MFFFKLILYHKYQIWNVMLSLFMYKPDHNWVKIRNDCTYNLLFTLYYFYLQHNHLIPKFVVIIISNHCWSLRVFSLRESNGIGSGDFQYIILRIKDMKRKWKRRVHSRMRERTEINMLHVFPRFYWKMTGKHTLSSLRTIIGKKKIYISKDTVK